MRRFIYMVLLLIASIHLHGQNTITFKIIDKEHKEALVGATAVIKGSANGAVADENGFATITDVKVGLLNVVFSFVGYETEERQIHFPLPKTAVDYMTIELEEEENEMEEVVISATRSTRTIRDIPTRVEFIGSEELEEKNVMKPGDIRMLLSESTGIQTQQTSAISGNSLIKIQGLDGKYTQILKDGFPALAGAAAGLGLLQTPPIDLRQVEIIKGSSSTLYGGGAIAGLVNLVSKIPHEKRDLQVQLNGTTGKGLDANVFYGQRFDKIGTTMLVSYDRNWAYDPSNAGFTAIPQFDRLTFNPTLFAYFSDKQQLRFGVETMWEKRLGGDMSYIKHGENGDHVYYEQNKSQRYSTKLSYQYEISENSLLSAKNSVSFNKRRIEIPDYLFDGNQWTTFSELSYRYSRERSEWIAGLNLNTESFKEKSIHDMPARDYTVNTFGIFAQNTCNIGNRFILETGLRGDYIHNYGFILLPRLSALYKISDLLSTRLGGGFGYKPPTIFSEESERLQFQNVMPIDKDQNGLERSYGANWDVNYRTSFADGRINLSVNQLFFYTYLRHPLELKYENGGMYRFYNIGGYVDSKGAETNLKIKYDDLSLFLGYTYTDAKVHENGHTYRKVLTPEHRFNAVLMYEIEDSWRAGYELYYVGKQRLTDGMTGKDYITMGIMVQKIWEKFTLYANFENFTDRRQTRFDTIYTGSISQPEFRDIYAPLDGFVANFGVIFKL